MSFYGESLCRRAYKQVLLVSALDIVADPESVELLILDQILTLLPISDPLLLPIKNKDSPIVLPEFLNQKTSSMILHSRLQMNLQK